MRNLKNWCPQREKGDSYVECLAQIEEWKQQFIVDMFSDDKKTRLSATAGIVDCCTSDILIMSEVLRYAREDSLNKLGVINTLYFFRRVDPELFRVVENPLNAFLDEAERNGGPQADAYVDTLRQQLQ